jgi:hypothetical protein
VLTAVNCLPMMASELGPDNRHFRRHARQQDHIHALIVIQAFLLETHVYDLSYDLLRVLSDAASAYINVSTSCSREGTQCGRKHLAADRTALAWLS